jgi:hypothetical protein
MCSGLLKQNQTHGSKDISEQCMTRQINKQAVLEVAGNSEVVGEAEWGLKKDAIICET